MCVVCRRGFLAAVAGMTLPLPVSAPAFSQGRVAGIRPAPPGARGLPTRGEFLLRNGTILTMDPQIGDLQTGSVYVKDGVIMDVGDRVDAPGAETLDMTDMIVLPGLIDTHWHMWHTLFRSFAGDTKATGFFPTITRFAKSMTPEDMYQSTRLAAAEAVSAGITTVHNWCHNIRTREHAEADIRALTDVGIRARWSFGQAIDQPLSQLIRLDDLRDFASTWRDRSNDGLLDLGMAWRGVACSVTGIFPQTFIVLSLTQHESWGCLSACTSGRSPRRRSAIFRPMRRRGSSALTSTWCMRQARRLRMSKRSSSSLPSCALFFVMIALHSRDGGSGRLATRPCRFPCRGLSPICKPPWHGLGRKRLSDWVNQS
jgi:hypothetical protein